MFGLLLFSSFVYGGQMHHKHDASAGIGYSTIPTYPVNIIYDER